MDYVDYKTYSRRVIQKNEYLIMEQKIKSQIKIFILATVLIYLPFMFYISRAMMLDDALIHLRYAINMYKHGIVTYDGEIKTYGTSSTFFTLLVGLAYQITHSVFSPKIISIIFYLSTIGLILIKHFKSKTNQYIWISLYIILLTPLSIRWLTDGMETSLVFFVCISLSLITFEIVQNSIQSKKDYLFYFIFGLFISLVRIELTYLILFSTLTILYFHLKKDNFIICLIKNNPLALGALFGILIIFYYYGYILPDTAIAKKSAPSLLLILTLVKATFTSLSFGIGLLLLIFISFGIIINKKSEIYIKLGSKKIVNATILINLSLAIFIVIISIKGQRIEGIRHFLWLYAFITGWNLIVITSCIDHIKYNYKFVVIFITTVIFLFVPEFYLFQRISNGRNKALYTMNDSNLTFLKNDIGLAADIGYIGYFSEASICDMLGLIGGREFAILNTEQRIEECLKKDLGFLFLDIGQIEVIRKKIEYIGQWCVYDKYDFPNVSSMHTHSIFKF